MIWGIFVYITVVTVKYIIFNLQLEQELKATSEKIKQCAPVVHVIAAKVQQLLSQS